jgi:hypothetical protein
MGHLVKEKYNTGVEPLWQVNATSSKLDIYIEDIKNGKHGSDTGSYDTEGR